MKQSLLVFLLAATMVLAGCSTQSPSDNPVIAPSSLDKVTETESVYHYVGYGRDGQAVVRGTMTLSVSTVGRVAGRWELRGGDPARIGPQVGRGTLTGSMVNGVLSVNLNPRNVDNNVVLTGRFSRTEYAGRWEWVTLRGVANGGTFRAARVRIAAAEYVD